MKSVPGLPGRLLTKTVQSDRNETSGKNRDSPDSTYLFLERSLTESAHKMELDFTVVDMRLMRRWVHQRRLKLDRILSEVEISCLEHFSFPKKRLQWISGRLAVKCALFKYKAARGRVMDPCCIALLNGTNSAPYLEQIPELSISITHSYPYCIGLVSTTRVGVDLERQISPSKVLLEQYYHPHELRELQKIEGSMEYDRQATLYWTRKEAVSKLLGLGLKMSFRTVDTSNDLLYLPDCTGQGVRLRSFSCSDFCLSLALEESKRRKREATLLHRVDLK